MIECFSKGIVANIDGVDVDITELFNEVLTEEIYMDEIAGFLPPVANPPTKAVFLTLLEQARA